MAGFGLPICSSDSDDLYGLYLKCLCQGLDNVLQDYRDALLAIEQDVLRDPHLHVSHITGKLNEVLAKSISIGFFDFFLKVEFFLNLKCKSKEKTKS